MGFDCFIKVIGKCALREFIQINKDICLKSYHKNICIDGYINKAQEWAFIADNRTLFINQIEEISLDKFKLRIGYYGNREDEDDDEFHLMNYSTLIFCEIILLDQQDPNLINYLKIFEDLEDLSIKADNVKFAIYYESSYKGSEKLDIDFGTINQDIISSKRFIHRYKHILILEYLNIRFQKIIYGFKKSIISLNKYNSY